MSWDDLDNMDDLEEVESNKIEEKSTGKFIKESVETHIDTKLKAYDEIVISKVKPKKKVKKEKPKKFKAMIKRGKVTEITAEERFDYNTVGIDTLRGLKFFTLGITDKVRDKEQISKEIRDLLLNPNLLGNFLENLAVFLKSIPEP